MNIHRKQHSWTFLKNLVIQCEEYSRQFSKWPKHSTKQNKTFAVLLEIFPNCNWYTFAKVSKQLCVKKKYKGFSFKAVNTEFERRHNRKSTCWVDKILQNRLEVTNLFINYLNEIKAAMQNCSMANNFRYQCQRKFMGRLCGICYEIGVLNALHTCFT